jgi:GNAT superfamily N-acetyltransferase
MIRTVEIADLPRTECAAREFYASSRAFGEFHLARFVDVWRELLASGAGVIFAYEYGGRIEGAIGGLVHRDLYGEALIAEEFFWFIRAAHRGAGVALYRQFERWARERGASSIQMVHLLDLMPEKVGRFYLRAGFQPIETRYQKRLE